jgi:cytoskeletal protein CcmA (bactofilin family)
MTLGIIICASLVHAVAQADHITEWGDGSDGTEFVLVQGTTPTIEILKGDGNTYKFYSETSQGNDTPGVISNITVDSGATGDFSILILHDDETTAGASDLKRMDLQYAGGTSTIIGLKIANDLAENGDILCEEISGDIMIGGGHSPNGSNAIEAAAVTGDITVEGRLDGDLTVDSLANLTVNGTPIGGSDGDITINSAYSGTIDFTAGSYAGVLTVDGNLTGTVDVNTNVTGRIVVTGDLTSSGRIVVGNNVTHTNAPPIHVMGSVTGTVAAAPLIDIQ